MNYRLPKSVVGIIWCESLANQTMPPSVMFSGNPMQLDSGLDFDNINIIRVVGCSRLFSL